MIKGPRFTVKGESNGFFVDLNIYDEDIEGAESTWVQAITDGAVQYWVNQAGEFGIMKARVAKAESSAGGGADTQSTGWQCPVHGAQKVYANRFQPGKKQCGFYSVIKDLSELANPPEWAQSKISAVQGEQRLYCKHKER